MPLRRLEHVGAVDAECELICRDGCEKDGTSREVERDAREEMHVGG